MTSSENKTCAICLGNVETGKGQAIFTAECSHSFHFGCIGSSVSHGNHLCPICRAPWKDLPFIMPNFNSHITNDTTTNQHPQPQPGHPVSDPEPNHFSDDEPLLAPNQTPTVGLQNVAMRAIPERRAVAASESMDHFPILVSLKAPSLSDDARQMQRAPIDIVTVLDVSGSMYGSKLDLVKRAVDFVIDNLCSSDRLSVVSFSTLARRVFPLRRMTESGRSEAKRAIHSLFARGSTNIVEGLKKGVQVLEERSFQNPVSSIIFLSDGSDTCNTSPYARNLIDPPEYLNLLPASIRPREGQNEEATISVHAFGFGSDHDPLVMHSIADSSGGTFSFIEAYEMVQDAFASCIGGLLSVVTQELRLTVRSASNGVKIKSIPSGRYASNISGEGSEGAIEVGDLYAEEEKEFLIYIDVPRFSNDGGERKTSLLDIMCSYKDVVSNEMMQVEGDLVEIRRPDSLGPPDMVVNLEVDRQRNRLSAAESIARAQRKAESGDLAAARALLSSGRSGLLNSASGQAGDGMCMWLEAEMRETELRMENQPVYERSGRAYAMSSMNAHSRQRATTRGSSIGGVFEGLNVGSAGASGVPGPYMTRRMVEMVDKSQQMSSKNKGEENPPKEE